MGRSQPQWGAASNGTISVTINLGPEKLPYFSVEPTA
jgi:hypothetical protein